LFIYFKSDSKKVNVKVHPGRGHEDPGEGGGVDVLLFLKLRR